MAGRIALDQLHSLCADAASSICSECEEPGSSSVADCGPSLVNLLLRQSSQVLQLYNFQTSETAKNGGFSAPAAAKSPYAAAANLVLRRLDDLLSIAYSKFYAFMYKDLPECWRQLYTDASILKFCLRLLFWDPFATEGRTIELVLDTKNPDDLTDLIRILDMALILAGAAGRTRGRRWIDKSLEILQQVWLSTSWAERGLQLTLTETERPAKRTKRNNNDDQIDSSGGSDTLGRQDDTFSTHEPFTPPVTCPIPCIQDLSMEGFQRHLDEPKDPHLGPEPLVIRGALAHWPAMTSRHAWSKPAYLLRQTFGGRRLVPIEIGRSYVDDGWGQELITFREFLARYIDPNLSSREEGEEDEEGQKQQQQDHHSKIAYLAQHPLLTQLPSLRADLLIPDYCYCAAPEEPQGAGVPELEAPLLNAWFGPPGTITPLHTDPYHNMLAQVVGRKYVRLYSPGSHDGAMQARGVEDGVDMANTSHVDVGVVEGWGPDVMSQSQSQAKGGEDNPDCWEEVREDDVVDSSEAEADAFAAFRDLQYVDCILEPGDMLYIPVGWWHYVRGLAVSFSVSFWWN